MNRLIVVAAVLSCWCMHRDRCAAPSGWYVNGARANRFELRPVLGRPQDDIDDARARRNLDGPDPVAGTLHCTGGANLRHDGVSVWCQR